MATQYCFSQLSTFFILFYFRQDLVCHDNQGGFVHVVLGDAYGHPKLSEVKHNPGLRFCYRNNYYPEYLTLLVGDINGLISVIFILCSLFVYISFEMTVQ